MSAFMGFDIMGSTRALQAHLTATQKKHIPRAKVFAVNRVATRVKSRATKRVAAEKNIRPAKIVRKRFHVRRATWRRQWASVSVFLRPVSWKSLGAKQNKRGVRAKGGRFRAGGFMGPKPGLVAIKLRGHAFVREETDRTPIEKLVVEVEGTARRVTDRLVKVAARRWFRKEFEHDLNRRIKRGAR